MMHHLIQNIILNQSIDEVSNRCSIKYTSQPSCSGEKVYLLSHICVQKLTPRERHRGGLEQLSEVNGMNLLNLL